MELPQIPKVSCDKVKGNNVDFNTKKKKIPRMKKSSENDVNVRKKACQSIPELYY